jgi:hypothetical protein
MYRSIQSYNELKDKSIKKEIRTQQEFYNNVSRYSKYELEASKRICKHKNVELICFNNDKYFDIMTSDNLLYEVKASNSIKNYNNIEIEYARNEPTGISTTKANYYIITNMDDDYYLIKTSKLLNLCKFVNEIKKLKYSRCYIIDIELLQLNSIKI